jgi:hypothetical protein
MANALAYYYAEIILAIKEFHYTGPQANPRDI